MGKEGGSFSFLYSFDVVITKGGSGERDAVTSDLRVRGQTGYVFGSDLKTATSDAILFRLLL